jgi:RNA polymerase sigma factor (sigma-70 family)
MADSENPATVTPADDFSTEGPADGSYSQSDLERLSDAELVAQYGKTGDERAAAVLHDRYLLRLMNLVGQHLARKFNPRLGPEDVVQSVFRSMFRLTREGRFQFDGEDDFWKLLLTMALNKVRNKVRREGADKRSPAREAGSVDTPGIEGYAVTRPGTPLSPAEVVEFADTLEHVLQNMTPDEQQLIQHRMDGLTQQEIGEKMGIDPRTVRRRFAAIRDRAANLLGIELPD